MIEIVETENFRDWLKHVRDRTARRRIRVRIERLAFGNPGDVKPVGHGVSELRVDYGPGYRVYFIRQGLYVIILLAGGDKSSQQRDIAKALEIANEL